MLFSWALILELITDACKLSILNYYLSIWRCDRLYDWD